MTKLLKLNGFNLITMNEQEKKILYEKVSYFKNHNIAVHILKYDERFNNGKILELSHDLIILDDEVLGAVPIYFLEIKFIEKRANEKKME